MTGLHAFNSQFQKCVWACVEILCILYLRLIAFLTLLGNGVKQAGVFTLLHCDKHLRLDSQHGEDHEGPGAQGQLHHGLHDGQETPGDQP